MHIVLPSKDTPNPGNFGRLHYSCLILSLTISFILRLSLLLEEFNGNSSKNTMYFGILYDTSTFLQYEIISACNIFEGVFVNTDATTASPMISSGTAETMQSKTPPTE